MRNQNSLEKNKFALGQTKIRVKKSSGKCGIKVTKKRGAKNHLNIPVYNLKGEEEKRITLPKEIFSVEVNPKLLSQYVRVYLANQRQGTASTKTRGEVAGSTRKIYRQKGTGRARHGDIKAPIFVGGGIVFGPKPRDFSLKINKKQKRKALFGALSYKQKESDILALSDQFLKIGAKTKIFTQFLKKLALDGQKILLVFPKKEKNNLLLASRNIPNLELTDALSINAYQVLNNEKIMIIEKALSILENHFLKKE